MWGESPADTDTLSKADPEQYELGLCLSGGGYRATLFHTGALCRINDAGLLPKLDMVSSVSGGSIAAGLLAIVWPRLEFNAAGIATNFLALYLDRILAFTQVSIDIPCIAKGLLNPFSTAAAELAAAYERHLFDSRRPMLRDLPERPWFVFCSSNLSTGSLFRMSNRYIADYRLGVAYGADLPVATAVAASSAFPPFLSPLRLDLNAFEWTRDQLDPSVGAPVSAGRAVLTDGGVYDNHGTEPALKRCRWLLVSDAGAPWHASESGFYNWFSLLRRVVDTTDNQVRSLRRRELVERFEAGTEAAEFGQPAGPVTRSLAATRGAYWSLITDPLKFSAKPTFPYRQTASVAPADIGTRLHFLGAAETRDLVNWGYFVSDIVLRSYLVSAPAPMPDLPFRD
jgi:predicted acylesterase/phospholipase RssA